MINKDNCCWLLVAGYWLLIGIIASPIKAATVTGDQQPETI
jgi:hypothetical protein